MHPERIQRGESHWKSAITDDKAREISAAYQGRYGKSGPTLQQLAKQHSTTRSVIASLVKGQSYVGANGGRKLVDERYKLTDADVEQIRKTYLGPRRGPTLAEVGKRFGVSGAMVSLIVKGKSRKRPRNESASSDNKGSQR